MLVFQVLGAHLKYLVFCKNKFEKEIEHDTYSANEVTNDLKRKYNDAIIIFIKTPIILNMHQEFARPTKPPKYKTSLPGGSVGLTVKCEVVSKTMEDKILFHFYLQFSIFFVQFKMIKI